MGRKTIEINLDLLKESIEVVEAAGPLANLSALYQQVSDLMVAKGETKVNPQLVRLRIDSLAIPVKTQKGRRGRQPGQKLDLGSVPTGNRRLMQREVYDGLLRNGPTGDKGQISNLRYKKVLDRAARGSIKARLIAKCMECSNFQQEEIRHCGCKDTCPIYEIRPFRTAQEKV
jgi:hypothetical protein